MSVFSFEKGSNDKNHFLSNSHHSIKKLKILSANCHICPLGGGEVDPLTLINTIRETLMMGVGVLYLSPKL